MNMLTPYDIAELLQVSYDTALEFIKSSGIAYIQVGRQYRVSEKAFEAFVTAGQLTSVKSDSSNIYDIFNSTRSTLKKRRK